MNLKIFMIFAAVVAAFFGLSLLFMPDSMIITNGLVVSDTARLFARSVGGMLIGVAAMLWLARYDHHSPSFRAIILGNLILHAVALVIDGSAVRAGVITQNAALGTVVHGFFILAFGYIYFRYLKSQPASQPK